MKEDGYYENRAAAYNAAKEFLLRRPGELTGWFVCKRKTGDFALWPMAPQSIPPKSYKIVDEVY